VGGIGPVHVETARRIACDSVRTLVTVAAASHAVPADAAPARAPTAVAAPVNAIPAGTVPSTRPLSVGRATRTIPPHIRTALALRDKGCRFPGCDRPPEWTDGHHIKHWADQGPTEIQNLVSLCRRHHRVVHERGWQIHIDEQGAVVVTPPP
jgi:hypothetical protein